MFQLHIIILNKHNTSCSVVASFSFCTVTQRESRSNYLFVFLCVICSQDRIRTCNNTTFMTSRVQVIMNRGVFRMCYLFHITYYLTKFEVEKSSVLCGVPPPSLI
jgi:hypothetical protein